MHLDQLFLVLDLAQTHSFNQTADRHYTTLENQFYFVRDFDGYKIFLSVNYFLCARCICKSYIVSR